jgi:hypothetical protein
MSEEKPPQMEVLVLGLCRTGTCSKYSRAALFAHEWIHAWP